VSRHPGIELIGLARGVDLEVARLLDARGLTARGYGVLSDLGDSPGRSVAELARRRGSTPDDLRLLLRTLQDAGLLREARSGSGHEPLLALTARGSETLHALDAALTELDARLFAGEDGERLAAAVLAATAEPEREPVD
jgi:DNA-binding MarR family transcriptional regulator